jgi:2'-5' RNA ligase
VPRLRLGVALLVPPPAAAEIDGLRRACGDGALGRIPAHLTLVPPVNVNVNDLGRALAVMRRAAAGCAGPIDVRLGPITTFAPATPVLYLAVGGDDDAVTDVQRLRDDVFAPPLARPLAWPFVPHVTLADDMAVDRIAAATMAMADFTVEVAFAHVTLLREGAPERRWSPIADARLGPPAVIARGGLQVELWWSTIADPEVDEILEHRSLSSSSSLSPPAGAEPFVVTARRKDLVLGAVRGLWRDGEAEVDELVVTDAAGQEDIERHLMGAVRASSPPGPR